MSNIDAFTSVSYKTVVNSTGEYRISLPRYQPNSYRISVPKSSRGGLLDSDETFNISNIQTFVALGLVILILVISWTMNILLQYSLYRNHYYSRHIIYKYCASFSAVMMLIAMLDIPPNVLHYLFGSQTKMDYICLGWLYADTFLCNVVFLLVLSSTLDSYYRIRNPRNYVNSLSKASTTLKLAAPWLISFIQTTIQFAICRNQGKIIQEGICLLEEPNFLILRTVLSYSLPMILGVLLIFLASIRIRHRDFLAHDNLIQLCKFNKMNFRENCFVLTNQDKVRENREDLSEQEDSPSINNDVDRQSDGFIPSQSSSPSGQSKHLTNIPNNLESNVEKPNNLNQTRMPPISEVTEHHCPMHGTVSFPINLPPKTTMESLSLSTHSTGTFSTLQTFPNPMLIQDTSFSTDVPRKISSSKMCSTSSVLSTDPQVAANYAHLSNQHLAGSNCPINCIPGYHKCNMVAVCVGRCNHSISLNPGLNCYPNVHSNPAHISYSNTSSPNNIFSPQWVDQQYASETSKSIHLIRNHGPISPTSASSDHSKRCIPLDGEMKSACLAVFKREKSCIAVNMALCIVSILLWSPYVVGCLLKGLCFPPECTLVITVTQLSNFKWLSYSTSVLYTAMFLLFDCHIRHAFYCTIRCYRPTISHN